MIKGGLHESNPWLFNFIKDGVSNGFPIFVKDGVKLDSNTRNLPTTPMDDYKITKWLLDALQKQRACGPFDPNDFPSDLFPDGVHVNPLGCVPKPNGKIRPIVHCSAPRSGRSVNSETVDEWKTVKYTSFLELVKLVHSVGPNGYLWCADAADAYLQLTLRPSDCKYVACNWLGKIVVFTVLIFGLSSAPRIYTHFADVIEMIVKDKDPSLFTNSDCVQLIRHYLDDFFGGHSSERKANQQFHLLLTVFDVLNVPYQEHKCSLPSRVQKILGYVFDTRNMTVSIPTDKYNKTISLLRALYRRRSIRKN